jgi:hypothetical protein
MHLDHPRLEATVRSGLGPESERTPRFDQPVDAPDPRSCGDQLIAVGQDFPGLLRLHGDVPSYLVVPHVITPSGRERSSHKVTSTVIV